MQPTIYGWIGVVITIIIVISIFLISMMANKSSINKEGTTSLQPYVFYIVWPILFILLIIASYYIFIGPTLGVIIFIIILILLLLYPIVTWLLKSTIIGSILMFISLMLTIILIAISTPNIQLLLTPLIVWLLVAICVSIGSFNN